MSFGWRDRVRQWPMCSGAGVFPDSRYPHVRARTGDAWGEPGRLSSGDLSGRKRNSVTPVTEHPVMNGYLLVNTETREPQMTDLLIRTALFITLTIGSSALMALPYVA